MLTPGVQGASNLLCDHIQNPRFHFAKLAGQVIDLLSVKSRLNSIIKLMVVDRLLDRIAIAEAAE